MMKPARVLAVVNAHRQDATHFDASSSIQELAPQAKDGVQVRLE